jgi:hypothetical protein
MKLDAFVRAAASATAVLLTPLTAQAGFAPNAAHLSDVPFAPAAVRPDTPSNPITPEPKIKRPNTTACVVTLVSNYPFENFTPATGPYAPPAASQCPGPWSKVIFDWNVGVSGIQYDRLGAVWLGGTEIFHFTTSEPPGSPITWHVEKDVTEYAQALESATNYTVSLGNLTTPSLTGIYTVTATLTFYEPGPKWPAATTPDLVAPISNTTSSPPWFTLNTPTDQASATLSLPTNIESAQLEVYATGHGCDEFWYAAESTAYEQSIGQQCGGTAYRELDVTVDGKLAAAIVPFPYLYTGAIAPSLWLPIPGHDTLNVPPYQVNLTPFVGVLTNGQPHTIAISVDNNSGYWVCDADLLLTEDHGASTTSGALTELSSRPANVEHYNESHLTSAGGTAEYRARHRVTARGYVDTSHGRVTTSVDQDWTFADHQNFANTNAFYVYTARTIGTTTQTVASGQGKATTTTTLEYPFDIRKPTGGPLSFHQAWYQTVNAATRHGGSFSYGQDVIRATTSGGPHTTEHFILQDSNGSCYDRMFAAVSRVLTGDQRVRCKG